MITAYPPSLCLRQQERRSRRTSRLTYPILFVGIREKILPLLSVEGINEDAVITYYLMNGTSPASESDTVIDENFAFAQTGICSIYAYAAETDNYAATASAPVAITVTPHADHCICGGSINAGDHTGHTLVSYQSWNGNDAIQYNNNVAYVRLSDNVTMNNGLTIDPGKTLYLCLNGKQLASNGTSKINVGKATKNNSGRTPARLVICDCKGGGTIKGVTSGWGGVCIYLCNSTLDVFGGKITGGKVSGNGGGGAIALDDSKCIMNMTGGIISGNIATGNGGGVYIYRSRSICNLSGGTIENNTAKSGGGIYVNPSNNGQLEISGNPVVKGNTVSGAANNVYLPSSKKLGISAAMSSGASIGITTESKKYPVVFSGKYSQDYSDYFFADAADAHVNYNANTELELAAGAKKYNVYIITDDNGTATVSASSATAGTTIRLTATPKYGYHFKDWQVVSGNAEISNDTFIMPAGNVTVKPVFEAHSF